MTVLTREEAVRRIVCRADLDEFAQRVLDTFWELPEFQALHPPREELHAWVRWNLQLVTRWLTENRPPSDVELEVIREHARARAAERVPADLVPANFRRGARFAWRAMVEAATEEERSALVESADLLFEYVDRVSRIYSEAYAQVASAHDDETAARALLRRIEADEAPRPEDRRLAERLGFDVDRAAHAFLIALPHPDTAGHAALAAALRQRGALAVSDGHRALGLANAEPQWQELKLAPDAAYALGPPAIGLERGQAVGELCEVVEAALARGHRGRVHADEYLAELLLRRSPRVAARIAQRVYGGLGPELVQTLDVLVEHDFERGATAVALPVHRNTLRDRLQRISEISGVDLDSAGGRGLAWLAWVHLRDRKHPRIA